MNLSRTQVADLVQHLQQWLATGSFQVEVPREVSRLQGSGSGAGLKLVPICLLCGQPENEHVTPCQIEVTKEVSR